MIALLGTGLLGTGFAERMLGLSLPLRVWNRSADKIRPLVERGAEGAADPASAVAGCSRVHLVLAEDSAVASVLEAARPGLQPGAWIIDHSTTAPGPTAARARALREAGFRYVHAPVFMAPEHARQGTGLMLLSAPEAEQAELCEMLAPLTGKVWYLGPRPDLAAVQKLMGNAMLFVLTGAMGDLLAMGRAQGVEEAQVLALFEQFRAGASLPFFGKRILASAQAEPTFTLEMARKDLRFALEAAGPGAAVLAGVAEEMDAAIAAGDGDRDYAVFGLRR